MESIIDACVQPYNRHSFLLGPEGHVGGILGQCFNFVINGQYHEIVIRVRRNRILEDHGENKRSHGTRRNKPLKYGCTP